MKTKLLIAFFAICRIANADSWTQKANFGGAARSYAVGFSIGTKAYIGTGYVQYVGYQQDFWEWDQSTNVWTQKADFGGIVRDCAVGFSIGTKGYIGTGENSNPPSYGRQDFWEWDQSTNVWTQKANLIGPARAEAVGFSIGTKGYIEGGYYFNSPMWTLCNDFWELDQHTNVWTQKANFGGAARRYAVAFSIGTKGYVGTGADDSYNYYNDFWEWDQSTNVWTQKANFGGTARCNAIGFSIANRGYIGTGGDADSVRSDFWEWDQANNVWLQKANTKGGARCYSTGFSIGKKGYIGTGVTSFGQVGQFEKDFWEYTPDSPISIAFSNVKCHGQNNGSATAILYTGTPPFTYLWNTTPAQTNVTASNLSKGTYSVLVTDAMGTTFSASITITQPPVLSTSVTVPTSVCSGNCATLTTNVVGNYGVSTYLWLPGSMTTKNVNICPTTFTNYTVTVNNFCGTNTAFTSVSVNPLPQDSLSVTNASSCTLSNGSILANVYGGATPYSYSWNTGATTNPATGLAIGNYSLTVIDSKGCKKLTTAEVSCPLAPVKNLQFHCSYVTPYNCFDLYWSAPDPSLSDTVVGYKIYRNHTLYAFTTNTYISCNPCIGDLNTTYCSFMYNPATFYAYVTAVYNTSHIESIFNDSIYNNKCGLIIGVKENISKNKFQIIPNPFSLQTVLQTDGHLINATLTVDNCFGQTVKQINNISGQTVTLYRDNLPSGLYFLRLTEDNKVFSIEKLLIVDN